MHHNLNLQNEVYKVSFLEKSKKQGHFLKSNFRLVEKINKQEIITLHGS